ncbi:alpha/beta fold hydrolase [Shewanella surugensis]|uniref:Alpha/beta hydrolase n=1 Tax=Shewanella surugensis TaxID=212020 RepID=A0ABT0LHX4_9GAMM|nr:alpha/beta hydrolase [Shewanella surugensis]MCL1127065.1 alpha/beta hydrolase [Shewanella surugensis]
MKITRKDHRYFNTSDNVKLHYIDKGSGQPLLIVPGFAQSVEQYEHQINGLCDRYRILAVDMRGHGDSEKVGYGYKVARFSKDLHEFITFLNLTDVVLLGHSLGTAVIWTYLELFSVERVSKLICISQPAVMISNPLWSSIEMENYGPLASSASLMDVVNSFTHGKGDAYSSVMLERMLSENISTLDKQWLFNSSLKLPRKQAAELMYNCFHQDWRDLLPRIKLPTLIIVGRAGLISASSQIWLHKQIIHSKIVIFEEDEGGKHFMFYENPVKFNQVVDQFIQSDKSE